jgi:glucose-6-phosphate dehydrogenase assembly protein OpcA
MPTRYKVLGQVAPSATTDTDIYTVPTLKDAIISTIVIANRNSSARLFRIAVRPAGDTLQDKHYVAFDTTVAGGDATTLTLGITLSATDVITIRSSTTDLSFSIFGSEIDL